jgi:hypothetical protein
MISINSAHAVNHRVKTLIHELAHALIHLGDGDRPELSYAEEELVVESAIFSVVGGLGIDTCGYSIPYLACWSQSRRRRYADRRGVCGADRLPRQADRKRDRRSVEPVACHTGDAGPN